ncbi:MAG TPA: cereblon family protein [Ignavibacteriaceae bacterium]|nr:cereblon family protein [Ignavibacteriaceae bacterium]
MNSPGIKNAEKEDQDQINNTIAEPEPTVKVQAQLRPDDWLCLRCSKKITEEKERFLYENRSEFRFTNPDGFIFDIITFRKAEGCIEEGRPTLEFTWFKDHSWSFAFCSRCGLHLGWKYSGRFSFYGLIKSRLLKGQALFN